MAHQPGSQPLVPGGELCPLAILTHGTSPMYTSYWKLQRIPFPASSDPRGYYPSEVHQGMLARLRYAIENARGGALLVGASGMGKTMILRLLAQQLPDRYSPIVHLGFPQMSPAELLGHLAAELAGEEFDGRPSGVVEHVRLLERVLSRVADEGRQPVVMIDDAHLLEGPRALEAVRLVMNIERSGSPALSIILSAQAALVPMLQRMPHLEERLGVKCVLRPLALEETLGYIQHRLSAAGAAGAIFTQPAMERVFQHTQGSPRRINRICELALLVGFAQEMSQIEPETIEDVAGELASVAAGA